jgi:hypothetical protein
MQTAILSPGEISSYFTIAVMNGAQSSFLYFLLMLRSIIWQRVSCLAIGLLRTVHFIGKVYTITGRIPNASCAGKNLKSAEMMLLGGERVRSMRMGLCRNGEDGAVPQRRRWSWAETPLMPVRLWLEYHRQFLPYAKM